MAEQAPAETTKNCPACKKPVKRVRWYYRNGKYFCTQNCWRAFRATAKSEPPAA
jgi:hypothetical protein